MTTRDPSAGFEVLDVVTDASPSATSAGLPAAELMQTWANELFRDAIPIESTPISELPRATPVTPVGPSAPAALTSLPFTHAPLLIPQATPSPVALASVSPRPVPDAADFPSLAELPWASLSPHVDLPAGAAREPSSTFYFLDFRPEAVRAPEPSADVAPTRPQPAPLRDASPGPGAFDAKSVARDFPVLSERVNGKRLVWLDNAATTQKPQVVIDRLRHYYEHENSNVHRGAHTLAARSSDAYEAAREKVRRFIGAPSAQEVVFVRGATEGINLVAQSWGRRNVRAGDEIVITWLEHHSNIVPWQLLCAGTGAKLRVAPVDDNGDVLLDAYERLFTPRTRLASITQVSNALGTVTPVRDMVAIAHRHGARVLVDGAQAVAHFPVNVQELDCDFYVFSGHKVFAPTGIGALYGRSDVLAAMPPWQGGGNMIVDVTFEKSVYQAAPMRFEAGTGNIADAVGLGAAIDYLDRIGLTNAARHEHDVLAYGTRRLQEIARLRLIGTAREKAGVLSFVIDGVPTEQIGAQLAREGIAVRAGHHCAQPALRRFGLESTVRPSLAFYNTREDIDALVDVLRDLQSSW